MVLKRVVGNTTKRQYWLTDGTIELITIRAARLRKTKSCYITDLVEAEQRNAEQRNAAVKENNGT